MATNESNKSQDKSARNQLLVGPSIERIAVSVSSCTNTCARLSGQAEQPGGWPEASGVEPAEADHPTHHGPPTCEAVGLDYRIIHKYHHITLLVNETDKDFCDSNRPY